MYDDKNIEAYDEARILIAEVRQALNNGTKHFRASDGKLLQTDIEILQALINEGTLLFEPKKVGRVTPITCDLSDYITPPES